VSPSPRESLPPLPDIPERPYFRIGQVAELLGVEPHVIRFWEAELPQITPTRAPSGRRIYRADDIRRLSLVRHLLYQEGYTIAGARKRLDEMAGGGDDKAPPAPESAIVGELKDILKMLK